MGIAIICAREWVRGFTLPLATSIGEDTDTEDLRNVIERFRELIGEEVAKRLDTAFNEALDTEISRALNSDELEHEIHPLVERFWARIALPLTEIAQSILSHRADRAILKEFISLEEKLGIALAKLIKGSGYALADDLVYGLSVLIDRDRWVLEKVAELGIDNFVNKLLERDPKSFIEWVNYTMYLTFTWLASTAAVLGIVERYREENRDKMAQWCRAYAKEVEEYMDTLDILLKDEVYEELAELGIVKR